MPLLGGVRPPIAALLGLLLTVAVLTALGLGTIQDQGVPQAVREAERQIAADAAASVGASIDARAAALRRSAATYKPAVGSTPATAVKSLLPTGSSVRGATLLDPDTGVTVAVSGEQAPLTGVDVVATAHAGNGTVMAPRLVTADNDGSRLLLFARVDLPAADRNQDGVQDQVGDLIHDQHPGERQFLLAVSETLTAPAVHGDGRIAQLVDRDGRVLAAGGAAGTALGSGTGNRALPALAANAANAAPHTPDACGSLLGDSRNGLATVAGWASVAGVDGKDDTADLGLTTLTFRGVAPATATSDHSRFAVAAAAGLLLVALLVTALLWIGLQRPLLRLHLSASRLARGVCDMPEELGRPVPVPSFGEPARTGRALESIRRQLQGAARLETAPLPKWRALGTWLLLLGCALAVAGWSVPMLFLANRAQAAQAVPAAAVADQQARTEAAADRVSQFLGQSYLDLAAVASDISGAPSARQAEAMRRALADHHQYRSLYVLDNTGTILLREGKKPLRTLVHAPTGSGITRIGTSGKVPAIAAYAQIPVVRHAKASDAAVLFAEIDVNALNGLLPRPGLGSVWLADEHHRVLAASVGFQAFQALPSRGLTRLAVRTEGAPGTGGSSASAVLDAGTGPSVAAAAPLARPAEGLGWRVVSAEPAAALKLTAYQVEARTVLAGLLALTTGVACLGWLYIVVIRPLHTLTRCAERLADGDHRTVLYPVHHDECGSVTRSLELLRQALVERDRRGGPDPAPVPAQTSRRGSAPRP